MILIKVMKANQILSLGENVIDTKETPSESLGNSEDSPENEKDLRLFVPREYVKELELLMHQSETKFVKSLNEGIHGGDFEGYIFEFEDEAKFKAAETVLEEMFTYNAGLWYSPKLAKNIEPLFDLYAITVLNTSAFTIFGKVLKVRNEIRGRERDLTAFYAEVARIKKESGK